MIEIFILYRAINYNLSITIYLVKQVTTFYFYYYHSLALIKTKNISLNDCHFYISLLGGFSLLAIGKRLLVQVVYGGISIKAIIWWYGYLSGYFITHQLFIKYSLKHDSTQAQLDVLGIIVSDFMHDQMPPLAPALPYPKT